MRGTGLSAGAHVNPDIHKRVNKVVTLGVSLYADDTLLYSEVNNDGDRLRFQANINALHK